MRLRPILSAALLCNFSPLTAAREETRTPLAPGVELRQTIVGPSETGGPLLIHALVVDPKAPGVRVEAALGGGTVEEAGGGREVVPKMATSTGAIAAVNAAFFSFDAGDPLGLHIHKGELVSEPYPGRPAMGFRADGTAIVGSPTFAAEARTAEGATLAINGVNRRGGANELIVYAPIYGSRALASPTTVAVVRGDEQTIRCGKPFRGQVMSVGEEAKVIAPLQNHVLLAGNGDAADWLRANLKPAEEVVLSFVLTDKADDALVGPDGLTLTPAGSARAWDTVTEAASGMPTLLAGGKPSGDPSGGESFAKARHPRTAGGVTKEGKFLLVVVDGRQTLSRGASLPELTEIMKGLGAVEAMNFDGGGSSTLSVQGLVINSPSDGSCRKVSDGLVVHAPFPRFPPPVMTATSQLDVVAGDRPVPVPVVAEPGSPTTGKVVWGTANGGAWVSQKGMAHGYKSGSYMVKNVATDGKRTFQAGISVLPGTASRLRPAWANDVLEMTLTDANGNAVPNGKITLKRGGGERAEVTTGADGKALSPAGWLADRDTPVAISSGALTATWPAAPAAAPLEKK